MGPCPHLLHCKHIFFTTIINGEQPVRAKAEAQGHNDCVQARELICFHPGLYDQCAAVVIAVQRHVDRTEGQYRAGFAHCLPRRERLARIGRDRRPVGVALGLKRCGAGKLQRVDVAANALGLRVKGADVPQRRGNADRPGRFAAPHGTVLVKRAAVAHGQRPHRGGDIPDLAGPEGDAGALPAGIKAQALHLARKTARRQEQIKAGGQRCFILFRPVAAQPALAGQNTLERAAGMPGQPFGGQEAQGRGHGRLVLQFQGAPHAVGVEGKAAFATAAYVRNIVQGREPALGRGGHVRLKAVAGAWRAVIPAGKNVHIVHAAIGRHHGFKRCGHAHVLSPMGVLRASSHRACEMRRRRWPSCVREREQVRL